MFERLPDHLEQKIRLYTAFEPNKRFASRLEEKLRGASNKDLEILERALEMLFEHPKDGIVVVFHRHQALDLPSLVCHRTAVFPTGLVSIADDNKILDQFTSFIAGYTTQNQNMDKAVRLDWRQTCRGLAR